MLFFSKLCRDGADRAPLHDFFSYMSLAQQQRVSLLEQLARVVLGCVRVVVGGGDEACEMWERARDDGHELRVDPRERANVHVWRTARRRDLELHRRRLLVPRDLPLAERWRHRRADGHDRNVLDRRSRLHEPVGLILGGRIVGLERLSMVVQHPK
jgi:hypothetical protein